MTDVTWDAATIERLREMRAVGQSARQIGRQLGATRNLIIGKCKRLGIGRAKAPPSAPKPTAPAPYVPPPPPVFSEPSAPIPTAALLPHHCRWSDSVESRGCIAGREGRPWCPEHRRRVYQPQKRAS